jgi:hypothetical protein
MTFFPFQLHVCDGTGFDELDLCHCPNHHGTKHQVKSTYPRQHYQLQRLCLNVNQKIYNRTNNNTHVNSTITEFLRNLLGLARWRIKYWPTITHSQMKVFDLVTIAETLSDRLSALRTRRETDLADGLFTLILSIHPLVISFTSIQWPHSR